jgi:hypothetical protein
LSLSKNWIKNRLTRGNTMKMQMKILIVIVLVLLSFAPIIGIAGALYVPQKGTGTATLPPGSAAAPQFDVNNSMAALHKESLTPAQKKISSDLFTQETAPAGSTGTATVAARGPASGATVAYVYVSVDPSASTHVIDSYVIDVTDRDETNHIAVAKVNFDNLEKLASRSEVRSIQQVIPPRVRMGSVLAESDSILKTDLLRPLYINGTGVKVGVISDGVDHYSNAVGTGDLPTVASGKLNILSNVYGGDEGTAMLEIIYDMAPGAKLYFHDMGTNKLAFNHAMDDLVAAGCTVIVDDVGWYDEPYFQDGMIAMHVKHLISSKNIIYVSSAGNDFQNHYQGNFYDSGVNNWIGADVHDFSAGTGGADNDLYVHIPNGGSVCVFLQWNDNFRNPANDYDLSLWNTDTDEEVAYSWNSQGPDYGGYPPFEYIYYHNTNIDADFAIQVYKYEGDPRILEVFTWTDNGAGMYANNLYGPDSIFGHAAVPGVLATGALDALLPGYPIEPFSSQGPVTTLYEGTRDKPDLVGIDNVAVTGAGGFPTSFLGTSAAAPTVAAVAAVLKSAYPAKTGQDIANRIRYTAVDLGPPDYDYIFGFGRPDAWNAYSQVFPPGTTLTVLSNPTGANLYVDGISQGTTPKTITGVGLGYHTLWFNKTNFMDDYSLQWVPGDGSWTATRTMTAVAGSVTSGGAEVVGNPDNAMFSLYVDWRTGWDRMDFGDNVAPLTIYPRASQGISYAVSAGDKLDGGKPATTKGKMAEYRYTTAWAPIGWASPGKVFSKGIRLQEPPSPTEYILTGTTEPIIFTDVGHGMDTEVPRAFIVKQQLTVSDRQASAAGENRNYRIPITFTLTAL